MTLLQEQLHSVLGTLSEREAGVVSKRFGRMLSLVISGPLVDLVRGKLVSARAGELKRAIESG